MAKKKYPSYKLTEREGQAVKAAISKKGLIQQQLADQLGCSRTSLAMSLLGHTKIREQYTQKLYEILADPSLDFLINHENSEILSVWLKLYDKHVEILEKVHKKKPLEIKIEINNGIGNLIEKSSKYLSSESSLELYQMNIKVLETIYEEVAINKRANIINNLENLIKKYTK